MARRKISWADLVSQGEFIRNTLGGVLHVENVTADDDTVFGSVEVSRVKGRKVYAVLNGEAEYRLVPDDNVIVTVEFR